MADDELFGELAEQARPQGDAPRGRLRLREPERDQIEMRVADLNSLIGEEHRARLIWAYVEGLDLRELEAGIKARSDRPGRPATSPRLLLALWLYATTEGVGSARALERLCERHDAYRWLCGGVSVNYHGLADFRVGCAGLLDRLLSEHLAALMQAGLVDLDTLAQDGVRIRANAGTSSFRREATLEEKLAAAKAVVEELKREVEASPDASNQRIKAARERAARQRVERIEAAQAARAEIENKRKELDEKGGNGKKRKEPRASITDADARVMKMADAGFRPAYNVQVASVAGEQIIVAIEISNNGSDRGQMQPMLEKLDGLGHAPKRHLADGGYGAAEDIEWAHERKVVVYCPPTKSKSGKRRKAEGEGVKAWRARMETEAGKAQYQVRTICECIHARWRNWGLRQLAVRGIKKVRASVLLYALTNNVLQGYRLAAAR
jgi:transposase